jgi:hypothetical protein
MMNYMCARIEFHKCNDFSKYHIDSAKTVDVKIGRHLRSRHT